MRNKTCCVTGHRDLPQKEINYVKAALGREVDRAVVDGYTCFMSGFGEGGGPVFCGDRTGETEREPGAGAYRRHPLPEAPGQPE